MKKLLLLLTTSIILGSCSLSNEEGNIKYFKRGKEPLIFGKVLIIQTKYLTEDDRLILQTTPDRPMAILYDTTSVAQVGLIKATIDQLKIGDSVYFEVPSKNLWEITFKRPLPDTIKPESSIKIYMMIEKQFEREEYFEYMTQLEDKKNEPFYKEEEKLLEDFLNSNKIKTKKLSSGLFYDIKELGNGDFPKDNDLVNVKYKGTLLDGTKFDEGSYEFSLGTGSVIRGWDEGIPLLKKGGKATLYIPSKLGYGSRGSGGVIVPFSSLIFEVEILTINGD